MLKPKSYRLAGISYDEICRGDRRSVSAVSVYATYATYQVARQSAIKCRGSRRSVSKGCVYAFYAPYAIEGLCLRDPWLVRNRHRISRLPADSLPLSNRHVRSGEGVPSRIYILYLYSYSNRGQNQGIFPAFEDKLRAKLLVPDKPYKAHFFARLTYTYFGILGA